MADAVKSLSGNVRAWYLCGKHIFEILCSAFNLIHIKLIYGDISNRELYNSTCFTYYIIITSRWLKHFTSLKVDSLTECIVTTSLGRKVGSGLFQLMALKEQLHFYISYSIYFLTIQYLFMY